MRIDLCICTFRRESLADTLLSVDAAARPDGTDLRIVVADNDLAPTARDLVARVAARMALPVRYVHAPFANISVARNAALDAADADWIAFLDDDEVVDEGWLVALAGAARNTGADAVFGPSLPLYPEGTPRWIEAGAFHAQRVPMRGGVIETGHTCNALVRWAGMPWAATRFDPRLGRTGGEDTAFFAELIAAGARFARADGAVAREAIPVERLGLRWLARRRFRIGQTYGRLAKGGRARMVRLMLATAKASYCGLRAGFAATRRDRAAFWILRGIMHSGVCAGCLSLPQAELYSAPGQEA